jgi:tight adherence protein B
MIAATDPTALTTAFAREADALARQLVVTAQVPKGSKKESSNVAVTIPTSADTFTASAYVAVRTEAAIKAEQEAISGPQPVTAGPLDFSPEVMYGAVGAIGLGLIGVVVILAMTSNRPATNLTLNEQMQAYGVMSVPGKAGPRRDSEAPNPFTGGAREAAERALANNKNLEARIAHSLEGAGMSMKPAEWLLMRAAIAVGGGLLGVLLGSGSIPLGIMFIIAALIGPWVYLRLKRSRRLNAFSMGLADTLQLMSGSLSAGLSLAQSIDTIVREGSEPMTSEFKRVLVETRLGLSLENALQGVADRFQSEDFDWVVMAINIQRQVGGNLAELLNTVAGTMREREYIRRQVAALAAEGKLSAYVLGGLPPGFMLYLLLANRTYVMVLFQRPLGWLMIGGGIMILSVGIFWMSRIVKVEV